MMLGKRSRPPMQRTTSMTEFTLDLNTAAYQPSDPHNPLYGGSSGLDQRYLASATAAAARPQRRYSADYDANFLRVCSLCNHRLIPGRDIYMYRGDTAFCSLECRHQQMTQDERKEKCSMASSKKEAVSAVAGTQVSAAGETVSAV